MAHVAFGQVKYRTKARAPVGALGLGYGNYGRDGRGDPSRSWYTLPGHATLGTPRTMQYALWVLPAVTGMREWCYGLKKGSKPSSNGPILTSELD